MIMKKILLFTVFWLGLLFGIKQTVSAQAVNYQTYKYGTKQISMASTYYVRPAQVVVKGNQYQVTMTIKTEKKLGAYPVKVLSIDGQAPFNIVKSRQGTAYLYTYSFLASNLHKIITSKIFVNVPGVYTAYHNLDLGFDTSNLPKLKAAGSSAKTGQHLNKISVSKSSRNPAGASSGNANTSSTTDPSLKSAQLALAKKTLAQNEKNAQANKENQKMFYYVILAGCLSSIVLIISAVFFILSLKAKNPASSTKK